MTTLAIIIHELSTDPESLHIALPKSQQEIGRVFIKLIEEAFAAYRKWQKTQDNDRYFKWAEKFKEKVNKEPVDRLR